MSGQLCRATQLPPLACPFPAVPPREVCMERVPSYQELQPQSQPLHRSVRPRREDDTEERREGQGGFRGWQSSPSPRAKPQVDDTVQAQAACPSCHTLTVTPAVKTAPLCPDKHCWVDKTQINKTTVGVALQKESFLLLGWAGLSGLFHVCSGNCIAQGSDSFTGARRGKTESAEQRGCPGAPESEPAARSTGSEARRANAAGRHPAIQSHQQER